MSILTPTALKLAIPIFYLAFFGGMVWIKSSDTSKRNDASSRVLSARDDLISRAQSASSSFTFAKALFAEYQLGNLDEAALDVVMPAALLANPIVYKMRILSGEGIELINYAKWLGSDGFYVEKITSLQDKSHRPFFYEALNQTLYISALDLLHENGAIYEPWLHTLRIGGEVGPVDGNGIVTVNLRFNEELVAIFPEGGSTSLFNAAGYCLANCPAGEFMGMEFGRDPPFPVITKHIQALYEKRLSLPITYQEQFVDDGTLYTIGIAKADELCLEACDVSYRIWFVVDVA